MKLLTYTGSIITALVMAFFQISLQITWGNILLIGVFNLGGVGAFIVSGKMNTNKPVQKWVIFTGALCVRAWTFIHITKVFDGNDMWNMIFANIVLIVFELALFFHEDSGGETTQNEHQDYQTELNAIIAHCETLGVYNRKNEPVLALVKRALNERTKQPAPNRPQPVKTVRKKRTGRKKPSARIEQVYNPALSVRKNAELAGVSLGTVQKYKATLNGKH